MKSFTRKKIVCGVVIGFFWSGLFVSSAAGEECEQLILSRCESCHYNTRICEKLGKKSRSSWKRTVKNMVSYGAKLDRDEIKQVIRCLSGPADDVVRMCEKK